MVEARKRDLRQIIEFKDRFVCVHSSSGHKHALNEVRISHIYSHISASHSYCNMAFFTVYAET